MTQATVNAGNPQRIDFRAPSDFRGTEIFRVHDFGQRSGHAGFDGAGDGAGGRWRLVGGDNGAARGRVSGRAEYSNAGRVTAIVDVGETFQILVSSIDLRPADGMENRGVEAAYLDVLIPLFSDAAGNKFPFADLVPDSIVYQPPGSPTYNTAQQGFFNSPAPGALNEAGGARHVGRLQRWGRRGAGVHGDAAGAAIDRRAADPDCGRSAGRASGQFGGFGRDGGVARRRVGKLCTTSPMKPPVRPQVLKTFFRPSGDLVIMGEGEGMFVNRANSMDVDMDNQVTAGDALEVINHLNAWGAQSLTGDMPATTGMVDVDMDSNLSAGDVLMVINFLNARGHRSVRSVMSSMPAGDGEGAPQSDGGGER